MRLSDTLVLGPLPLQRHPLRLRLGAALAGLLPLRLASPAPDAATLDWAGLDPARGWPSATCLGRQPPPLALRGVLWECWRLGLLDAAAYARVASIASLPSARPGQEMVNAVTADGPGTRSRSHDVGDEPRRRGRWF